MFNFIVTRYYDNEHFSDVDPGSWYSAAVETVYRRGLMKGTEDFLFSPQGVFTLAETVTIAARMQNIYHFEQAQLDDSGSPWYRSYVDYALTHGILQQELENYTRPATRAEFATLLCAALPEDAFSPIQNDITFFDVSTGSHAYPSIMILAQAGILGGREEGKFEPDATITRAEVAAVLARIVKPSLRLSA